VNPTVADPDDCSALITGLVLAGGAARRMGGLDKGLVELAGRPMIEWVLEALRPQVGPLMINANRNPDIYSRYAVEVISDVIEGYLGPLAGVASALPLATTPYLMTVPCDTPLLPGDLAPRLLEALRHDKARIAAAHDGERLQPVFMLVERDLADDLQQYLREGGRKIDTWFARHRLAEVDLSDRRDCFVNVNDPEEKSRVESLLLSKRP
jgi:molybdopterin-guanine dinucleotide biosynthesis protein A